MAKNLTDLTARTATADTDLLHINSGGTDYKETKENFTANLCKKATFDNTSDFRAQCKTIAANGSERMYYGILASYGHQTECGTPSNHNYYVMLQVNSSTAAKVELTIIGSSGRKFESYMNQGTWSAWVEIPTRSEMDNVKEKVKFLALIDAGTSKTFNITSGASSLVVSMSSSAVRCAVWFVYTAGSGSVYAFDLGTPGGHVSISSSTANQFTVSNSSTISNKLMAIVFEGTISVASS